MTSYICRKGVAMVSMKNLLVMSSLLAGTVFGQTKEFQKEADPPLNCSTTERAR